MDTYPHIDLLQDVSTDPFGWQMRVLRMTHALKARREGTLRGSVGFLRCRVLMLRFLL